MWFVLGGAAIVTAILQVVACVRGHRSAKWLSYASLSLTALTLCTFFSGAAGWALQEKWDSLIDVLPALSKILWVLTICSILVNSVSLFRKEK